MVALNNSQSCLKLGHSRGINGVSLPIATSWGLSDSRIAELREMSRSFSIKLHSELHRVSGRLGMSGGRSHRHAQNPLLGERRKTLSITHHALSPPPSHHHLYIIHLINWLQSFYRITMSLKRPFVSKNDVKQWFTNTTTTKNLWYTLPCLSYLVLINTWVKWSTCGWSALPRPQHRDNYVITRRGTSRIFPYFFESLHQAGIELNTASSSYCETPRS